MKKLKLFLVMLVMILSSALKAETPNLTVNLDSVSVEIEKMLKDLKLDNDNRDLEVTVFFSVSEDQKIQSLSVASSNKEVNKYIQQRLENKPLPAEVWMQGKIYELTVVKKVS